ncbi:hypothetical protein Golax_023185 [Gossypium laxum]|uniref:Aminotransferase-like plant mobile domain-containing protein n=1 Tax=Gossypium laxum TaxID=34288 RepID=A0A7J9AYZ3_9ROSI|nr:hypothetical protein [Gossypium laxum]
MRLVIILGREDLCDTLLGKVPNKFQGGWVKMKWLEDNFGELDEHTTALKNEQYAQAFILRLIVDLLMPDKSQNLLAAPTAIMGVVAAPFLRPRVDASYTFSLVTRWNFRLSYVGLPKQLKDIQLLLDQRPEAKFEWMSYIDPTIVECILPENLANQNIEPLHKLDLREKTDKNWREFHKEYIDILDHRNDFILIREPFFTPEMAASAKYMPWFRHHGKSYLLSVEVSSRQIRPRGHDDGLEILGPDHMA